MKEQCPICQKVVESNVMINYEKFGKMLRVCDQCTNRMNSGKYNHYFNFFNELAK